MSPISAPEPCPHIYVKESTFYFCNIYERRPIECQNHNFPSRYCPIGVEKLGLTTTEAIRERLDAGYALLKYKHTSLREALNKLYGA